MRTTTTMAMAMTMIWWCRARVTTDRVEEEGKDLEARSERRG
jgi:hypothetical protein